VMESAGAAVSALHDSTATMPVNTPRSPQAQVSATHVDKGVLLNGRYRVCGVLGGGSTSTVYDGIDELLNRRVAIKAFDANPSELNSLARQRLEMLALAAVQHPNLLTVYDAHLASTASANAVEQSREVTNPNYLVLELVTGTTLSERLQDGPLPCTEVWNLGIALSDGLSELHDALIAHRDIKPANVLITADGIVKLADFGLVRMLGEPSTVTMHGDVMGTAAYLSPEQVRTEPVGTASDVYSLGLVLLECLTGRREFSGEPAAAALARLDREPEVPSYLPAPWPALLRAMTDIDPSRRPAAAAVHSALQVAASEQRIGSSDQDRQLQVVGPPGICHVHESSSESLAERQLTIDELFEPAPAQRSRASSLRRFLVAASAAAVITSGAVIVANVHNTNAEMSRAGSVPTQFADTPSAGGTPSAPIPSSSAAPSGASSPASDVRHGVRAASVPSAQSTTSDGPMTELTQAAFRTASGLPVNEPVVVASVADAAGIGSNARSAAFSDSASQGDVEVKQKNDKAKKHDKDALGQVKNKETGNGEGKKKN
jgi:eukaryotic-like serine/threonine-protein kinase